MSSAQPTHRCNCPYPDPDGSSFFALATCPGARYADGSFTETCGEPCSFVMGKGGSAEPDWGYTATGDRVEPSQPDGQPGAPILRPFGAALPIEQAPKDRPILAWCEREVDNWDDPANVLTEIVGSWVVIEWLARENRWASRDSCCEMRVMPLCFYEMPPERERS